VKPATRPARLGVLIHQWPGDAREERELLQLASFHPDLRIYSALCAVSRMPDARLEMRPHLEFLPDGMVLEGLWRQESELAHRLEVRRIDFTSDLASEWFLQQARYALYMRDWVTRDGIAHLHAMSTASLLWGWMLHQLTGVTLSVDVEAGYQNVPKSDVLRVIKECEGARFFKPAMMATARTAGSAGDKPFTSAARGDRIEDEWLKFLANAAGLKHPAKLR
jgi:hypothetical protein